MSAAVPRDRTRRPAVHIGISKRVAPLATRRNRIKRLIREALRRIPTEPGNLYHIRVERFPEKATAASVERSLAEIFK